VIVPFSPLTFRARIYPANVKRRRIYNRSPSNRRNSPSSILSKRTLFNIPVLTTLNSR
jgi:hypothetical protein